MAELVAWVEASGVGPVVEMTTFRQRPWGTIHAIEVADGPRVYAKEVEPKRRFEAVVTPVVSAVAPTLAPTVLAVDEERGWLLLDDHGAAMADVLSAEEQVDAIRSLLPAYAAMQRATIEHVEAWLAAGIPDRRVEGLPVQFDSFLDSSGHRELVHECGPCLPAFAGACAELAEAGAVPSAALDHADIHGTNVLFDGHHARLADWGDACITHPFCSLFVPSHLVLPALPVSRQAAAERSLRDAYLGPWGGPTAANVRLVDLAMWVAPVVRVLSLAAEHDDDADGEIAELLAGWARSARSDA